ncbi:hypothetical protein CLV33_107221 [Jejuia pallidilutea]|uniref:Uncharacterized protein n=1 Tax=Jejuia pallidilutea TaxID=504487 RepID=A0A362WZ28_9FLAO|nr:hypothetical protein [Jejuia pallidilutea]PQV47433.1 hypothetical protein CLV33_107221 [Jejuia pallidilutea]
MKIYKMSMLVVIALLFASCDFEQKKKAELPEVDMDVEVEEGQLPTFDVDWADVNVGTKTKTLEIPKVVIVMEEEEVEVPYIDIDMPQDDNSNYEKVEQNIMVEAEVTDKEHELDIKEIRAGGSTLYVISQLEEKSTSIGDKKLRVSDQVSLNAPDNLNVKHYIVGERPDRVFNSRYKYFNSMSEATNAIKDTKVIYSNN